MARRARRRTGRLAGLALVFGAGAAVAAGTPIGAVPASGGKAPVPTGQSNVAAAGTATASVNKGKNAAVAAPSSALLDYLGEFSDQNGEWTDPASLDDSGALERAQHQQKKGKGDDGTAQN